MTADIYWITDLRPGRLVILGRPRPGEWLADEIADWASAGLTDVVSLLEDYEVRETGLLEEAALTRQVGISLERLPIPDPGVPVSIDATRRLWTHLAEKIRSGRTVGIHCRASIDRAGMIATGARSATGRRLDEDINRTRQSGPGHRPTANLDRRRFSHAEERRFQNDALRVSRLRNWM
jgi:protein-tyrosine phosphatase